MKQINREQWLTNALPTLKEIILARTGLPLPRCRVSVGFSLSGTKAIGVCFRPENTRDRQSQVYISPRLDNPIEVLDTLMHELIHVLLPNAGHRKPFVRAAKACGLTQGKPTQCGAGAELLDWLTKLAVKLGPYPHAAIILSVKKQKPQMILEVTDPTTGQSIKAPANRLLRLIEPKSGYAVWVETRFLLVGFPTYDGRKMVIVKTMEGGE